MNLHFKQYGESGSPIIILHGLFGSGRNWQSIASFLAKEHTVYAIDLRNHGNSPHTDDMDYQHMADDVLKFLDGNNLSSVNVIGHSMGGKTAMWMALTQPERVNSLVVVDIAPIAYQHNFDDVLGALRSVPLDIINSRQDAEQYLAKDIEEEGLRQFLLQNLHVNRQTWKWRINLDGINHSMPAITGFPETEQLLPYKKRSLFIAGSKSDYITKENGSKVKQLFPSARTMTVKEAGHWPHAEKPAVFKALIKPFFSTEAFHTNGKTLH